MAKGIRKLNAVSSISTADKGAGDSCRVMVIKRDSALTAIDRAFADHWLGIDNAFAESIIDGTGAAGFDRRAAKLRKKLDGKLREVRRDAVWPADPAEDRPSLSAGADPSDVESDGAFADRDGARRFRQDSSPGMVTPEGDDVALSPAPSDGSSDRLGPTARQRYERMQKAASAQRRDGESDAMAFNRWITETPAGKAAYAEDRHAALTEACRVYRRGSQVAPSVETGPPTDDDDDPDSAADPTEAEDQFDNDDDDPEAAYRALMRKAEELAAEQGITQAQAFERLLIAREPELRKLVKCARGR
jgi:hypothetical protein